MTLSITALCIKCHYAEEHFPECLNYAEFHQAECPYTECRGAVIVIVFCKFLFSKIFKFFGKLQNGFSLDDVQTFYKFLVQSFGNDTLKHNDTQHNDTQHNDTQHNDTQHNDTQHNDTQHKETQHNDKQHNHTQHNDNLHISK